jgi:hypothetical protein
MKRLMFIGSALLALSGCLVPPSSVEEARGHSLYSSTNVGVTRSADAVYRSLTGQRAQSCFSFTLQRTSGAFGGPTAVEQENFRLRPESRRSIILERLSVRGWYPYGIVDISSAGGGARATITMQRNDLVFREALEGYIRGDTSSCPKNSPFL